MTIILRIVGFHNCDGCSRRVRKAVRKIGVELGKLDRESGTVTITTAEPPEGIRYALERQLKKSVVVVSGDLVPANQNPNFAVPHGVPANRALDLQDLTQVMLRLVQVLDGAKITIRFSLNNRENPLVVRPERSGVRIRDADNEYAPPRPPPRSPPWAATEPSAPLMSTPEQAFYGYPRPDYYGIYTTRNHDHPNE